MNSADKQQLKIHGCQSQNGIIEGVYNAKSIQGGSLSAADIFTYLFSKRTAH